jgi:hypothetical protein
VVVEEQGSIGRETVKSSDGNWKGKTLGLGAYRQWMSSSVVRCCYGTVLVKESGVVEMTWYGHNEDVAERGVAVLSLVKAVARRG